MNNISVAQYIHCNIRVYWQTHTHTLIQYCMQYSGSKKYGETTNDEVLMVKWQNLVTTDDAYEFML